MCDNSFWFAEGFLGMSGQFMCFDMVSFKHIFGCRSDRENGEPHILEVDTAHTRPP